MALAKTAIWIFLVVMTSVAQAGVYKWTDEQGRVHYGDKPTSTADEVKINNQRGSGQADQPASRRELQQRFLRAREEERKEKQQERNKKKQKIAEAKQKCVQAKKQYDKYHHAGSIYVKGKDGEREHLSFKERDAYEKLLASKVKKWCGR